MTQVTYYFHDMTRACVDDSVKFELLEPFKDMVAPSDEPTVLFILFYFMEKGLLDTLSFTGHHLAIFKRALKQIADAQTKRGEQPQRDALTVSAEEKMASSGKPDEEGDAVTKFEDNGENDSKELVDENGIQATGTS